MAGSRKRIVKMLAVNSNRDSKTKYVGRLLGAINEREFHHIMTDKDAKKKLATRQTMPLKDIIDVFSSGSYNGQFSGMRLVMVPQKKDKDSVSNTVFITEKLGLVSKAHDPPHTDDVPVLRSMTVDALDSDSYYEIYEKGIKDE